ncbi:MAG TPA: DUF885 domain-containing protein [Opitutus sp.]|nr:DUF885 domain-containing protein [Opitutus sp.]
MSSSVLRARRVLPSFLLLSSFALAQPAPPAGPAKAGAPPAAAPRTTESVDWNRFVTAFLDSYFAANPSFAVAQGRHEFDGQLPDWSDNGLKTAIEHLEAERAAALTYDPAELSASQRFERDYLVAIVHRDLFWLENADQPHTNPYYYADPLDPDVYVSRNYAPLPKRLDAYIRYARAVPDAIAQIQHNLQGPLAKPLLAIGRTTIGGLADFYENDVPKVFAAALTGDKAAEFNTANAAAIKAVRGFAAWLDEREKTAPDTGYALGPKKFLAMLRETDDVDITLPELQAVAQKDLDRNWQALEAACASYAPGKTLPEAVAMALAHKPAADQVITVATSQLADLRKFVLDHNLLTIPGTEQAKVAVAPPYKAWNIAYIDIPGPYEHDLPSTYYISPPDPSWPKEKQDAYIPGLGPLLFTSVHEVYPGHFVQYLHANRAGSKFGQVFVTYAFSEGWAHYVEEMMWDSGLANGSPEMHIGQLEEALLRDVRFIVAIGEHTQGMTVAEATRLFREKGLQDPANAEQQAARGTFDPAFLNYTLGKLMIRKLRDDWCASRGGQAAWKEFHDQFLSYGGPPIPLVRRAMLGPDDKGSLF